MKKLRWNRFYTILVLLMFITVTFASFNTNLFINGKAYLRVDKDIRITNIRLLETEYNGYENNNSEYTVNSVSMDVSLPRQASSLTYEVTITNVSDKRYKITDIIEDSYNNKDVKYELIDASIGNIVEPQTTKTFTIKFTNNKTITEEDNVYETKEYTFDYTGGEQVFAVPYDGEYTLEVWGAQAGSISDEINGGYGGYSKGTFNLKKNKKIYINVGGQGRLGEKAKLTKGGYNGGGTSYYSGSENDITTSGGGATHIAITSGTLDTLEKYKEAIILVAGGGGGSISEKEGTSIGGSGGGFMGGYSIDNSTRGTHTEKGNVRQADPGTQTSAGQYGYAYNSAFSENRRYVNESAFGIGGGVYNYSYSTHFPGGGGGYYGGATAYILGAAGGSGYIGNDSLKNKVMYCFRCTESTEESTKTISTESHSETPTSNYAKEGNGYVKITLTRKIEDNSEFDFDYTGGEQTYTAPYSGIYKLEVWGSGGNIRYSSTAGKGGYAVGNIKLDKDSILYINVGGKSSYNGGGNSAVKGAGATHIALKTGLLKSFEEDINSILIVAGGGGGYYGGGANNINGSGGSSFISGHNGCVAITSESDLTPRDDSNGNICANGTTDVTCSKHYSNYIFSDTKMIDGNGYEWTTEVGTEVVGMPSYDGTSTMTGNTGDGFAKITLLEEVPEYHFDYTGNVQEFIAPYNGIYKVELWGASGGGSDIHRGPAEYGGAGAYTSGELELKKNEKIYVYVGQYPTFLSGACLGTNSNNSFNGQTSGSCSGGGGATDIRLTKGTSWVTSSSLASRIMVAAGGGAGFYAKYGYGGAGGELKGQDGTGIDPNWTETEAYVGLGGTQVGKTFGKGGYATSIGGGGYYGGSGGRAGNAGGGSSFISGYKGCIAIKSETDITPICEEEEDPTNQEIACSYHYSGYKFTNGLMIAGTKQMPTHDGRTTMIGNTGNGYAKITLVEKIDTYKINYDLDGGTLKNKRNTYSRFDEDITLENPTKEGYVFAGWIGGKNLFNKDSATLGVELKDGGVTQAKTYWYTSEYIPIKESTNYFISGNKTEGKYNCFYDENKNIISIDYSIKGKITSPKNAKYLRINGLVTEIDNIQLEEGSEATSYENYITTPTMNITISKGLSGNRYYKATWEKIYDIEYDLNGGTLNNPITSYLSSSESFNLQTPTKENYRFLGWTGGKNIFWRTRDTVNAQGITSTRNSDGTISYKGTLTQIYFDIGNYTDDLKLAAGTYTVYAPVTNNIITSLKGKDSNGVREYWLDSSNNGKRTITFNLPFTYYFYLRQFTVGQELDGTSVIQIEKGDKFTGYEPYISTPQSITIAKGSSGHRKYYANWKKLIYLDVNTYVYGEHTDSRSYTGEYKNQIKFDVYINGVLEKSQVNDYCYQKDEGTTYEVKNFTYDTDKWTLKTANTTGTLTGDVASIPVTLNLLEKEAE